MKVRDFLVQIPALCGAKNAERIAELFVFAFDREFGGDSPFDRSDADRADFGNRSRILWAMLYDDPDANVGAVAHCKAIMEVIERSHYLEHHGERTHERLIASLVEAIKADEPLYPDIAKALPIEEAVTLGGWNF